MLESYTSGKDLKSKQDKTKLEAIELLLLDVENEIIQATIRKPLISKLSSTLTLGEVYNIRNLTVGNNTGLDKATSNACRLQFEFSSKVTHITDDVSIPSHGYRFAKFEDIINGRVPTTHYIDVVGKLYEIGPVTETKNGYKCRTIRLEDVDGCQISCTLWSPHHVELPSLISKQPNPHQSKIIVIQCVETRKFAGQWRVQTTYNATVYQINPSISEVYAFEESLSTQAPSNSLQIIEIPVDDVEDDLTSKEIKTIGEIVLNENAGSYYILAKIIDLDCTSGWYYESCKSCWAKTTKNDKGKWVCGRSGCDGNNFGFTSRIPRFQVKFLVTDSSDEEAHFVVFDSQISQFINESAEDLISNLEKSGEPDSIPTELETFIDKQFLFKVDVHEKFNVENSSKSYTVLSMSDDSDKVDKWMLKYTEKVKEELERFRQPTTELVLLTKKAEGERSESVGTTSKTTPLKRRISQTEIEVSEHKDADIGVEDASSATKKSVVIKKEKQS